MLRKRLIKIITSFSICAAMAVTGTAVCGSDFSYAESDGNTITSSEALNLGSSEEAEGFVEGEAVVLYDTDEAITKREAKEVLKEADVNAVVQDVYNIENQKTSETDAIALVKNENMSTEKLVEELNKCDDVLIAEPNYKVKAFAVSDAAYYDFQWALDNKGQNGGTANEDVNIEAAPAATSEDKVVAIIDTGVDYTHKDLKDNMWKNDKPESTLNGEFGIDTANNDDDPYDDAGHGTHCAGIIAGAGHGISGVNGNVKIMALKFLDEDGFGDTSGAIAAYEYISKAQDQGVDVVAVNNSWGGDDSSAILNAVIKKVGEKGAVSVCAAGNESENFNNGNAVLNYPAALDNPYIVSVAATDENGQLAPYSNYGSDYVDIAAPGSDILSSVSYDSYFPALYGSATSKKQKKLSQKYNSFDEAESELNAGWTPQQTEADMPAEPNKGLEYTAAVTAGTGYGKAGTSAFEMFVDSKNGKGYVSYRIPYTVPDEGSNEQFFTMMVKTDCPDSEIDDLFDTPSTFLALNVPAGTAAENISIDKYSYAGLYATGKSEWNRVQLSVNAEKAPAGTEREIVLLLSLADQGKYDIRVDEIGLSRATATESSFGKYDNYSGTSMAAPVITAAAALYADNLSDKYKGAKRSDAVIDRLICGVNEKDYLSKAVSTEGILDFSKHNKTTKVIKISGATVDLKGDRITINGRGFSADDIAVQLKKADVEGSTYKKATIVSKSDTQITIEDRGWINHYADIKITTPYKTVEKKNEYLVKGKTEFATNDSSISINMSAITTDGKLVYATDADDASIVAINPEDAMSDNQDATTYIATLNLRKLFGKKSSDTTVFDIECGDQLVYADGMLYNVAKCVEMVKSSESVISTEYRLVAAEANLDADEDDNVLNLGKLPASVLNRVDWTMTAYNGKIYIMGGYSRTTKKLSNVVNIYNPKTKKWYLGTKLPAGRAGGKAVQVNNQLVYVLGYAKGGACPPAYIFDGTSWKVSAKTISPYTAGMKTVTRNGRSYVDFDGAVAACKDGVIFMDIPTMGYGSVFKYSISKDKYFDTGYCLPETLGDSDEDNDYFFSDEDGDEKSLKGIICQATAYIFDETKIYTKRIMGPNVRVKVTSYGKGSVYGKRLLMPGNSTVLTAKADPGYYCKSFKVGEKDGSKTLKISQRVTSDITGKAVFAKYTISTAIAKDISAGKTYPIKIIFSADAAKSQKTLTYTSSNTKYASVSSAGVVTAKKAGVGKTVTITVKADSKTYSKVKITIK